MGLYVAGVALAVVISIAVGFEFHLVSVTKVYDLRSDFAQKIARSPVLGYAVPWMSQVVAPLLLVFGIIRRKRLHCLAGVASVLLVYSVTGFKSALFAPVLIIAIKKILEIGKQSSGLLLPVSISLFLIVSVCV